MVLIHYVGNNFYLFIHYLLNDKTKIFLLEKMHDILVKLLSLFLEFLLKLTKISCPHNPFFRK